MAVTSQSAREYETIYILRPDIDADSADRMATRVSDVITRENGKIVKFESWGRRKLAYEVAKHRKGVYIFVKYIGGGGLVAELERNLRLSDDVIKHMTVVVGVVESIVSVQVDPEEAKFRRLELTPDEDDRISREKLLGFVEGERREEREVDDFDAKEDDVEAPDEPVEAAAPIA